MMSKLNTSLKIKPNFKLTEFWFFPKCKEEWPIVAKLR